jgi:streptogramin lyase
MREGIVTSWVAVLAFTAACGGDRGGADSGATDGGSESAEAEGDGDGDAEGDGDGDAEGDGDGDGGMTTKWDVLGIPDLDQSCEGKCGETGFSYIFIANSNQSTMSKINTETLVEEGRYLTRADSAGNPSRTSVSIDAQLGAINNRAGGVLAVWSVPELCDPNTNGQPGVQTSSGGQDVLPWGQDDCVAWYADFPGYTTQRPIAWTAGQYNEQTCTFDNQKLWTSGCGANMGQWAKANRLHRDTGAVEDTVDIMGIPCGGFGGYGGAADGEGNFWVSTLGSDLSRVDGETLDVQHWTIPISVYGITVDSDNRVWMSSNFGSGSTSAVRFDPETEQFDLATGNVASAQTGIAEDGEGRMWMNHWGQPPAIYPIDKDTMVTGAPFLINQSTGSAKGVAVDKDGYIWSPNFDNNAYRIDPDDNIVDSVPGLDFPYTYSDMTGGALTGVTCGSPTG